MELIVKKKRCDFLHTMSQYQSKECRDGVSCMRFNCRFSHPEGFEPLPLKECRNGDDCTRFKCRFSHPEGFEPVQECINGSRCQRTICHFSHPTFNNNSKYA